jgi:multiple sugar transport system substrate-binding protein
MYLKRLAVVVISGMLLTGCSFGNDDKSHGLSANSPTTITLGTQEDTALQSLVDEFNSTEGKKRGIVVEVENFSTESDISGVDVVCADYDTIYNLGLTGDIADLSSYYSSLELGNTFFKQSLELNTLSGLRAIPLSTDVNVLAIDQTLWNDFASQNALDVSSLSTWDGVLEVANTYSDYSDGKPLLTIDDTYNMAIELSYQMNLPLAQASQEGAVINLNNDNMLGVWDSICVPQIKGLYVSGVTPTFDSSDENYTVLTYCPLSEVPNDDNIMVVASPCVTDGINAHMLDVTALAVNSSDEDVVYAGVQFIKWVTSDDNSLEYALNSKTVSVNVSNLDNSSVESKLNGGSYDVNTSGELVGLSFLNDCQCFRVSAFDNVSVLKSTFNTKFNKTSSADVVAKKRANGVLEDKIYEDILDSSSFQTWYDDLCSSLKVTFGEGA